MREHASMSSTCMWKMRRASASKASSRCAAWPPGESVRRHLLAAQERDVVMFDHNRGPASAHANARRRRRRLAPNSGLGSRASAARGQQGCRSSLSLVEEEDIREDFRRDSAAHLSGVGALRRVPMVCGARRMGGSFLRRRGWKLRSVFESAEGVRRTQSV